LLDIYCASAVIDFVGYIRRLGGDVADLANKGDLGDFDIVDTKIGVGVGLGGFEDLLDGDWSEGIFSVCSLSGYVRF
jgi:hypothetical protein